MATKNNTEGGRLPIIDNLWKTIEFFLRIGTFIEDGFMRSFFLTFWGACGVGKSATIHSFAKKGVAAFFLPGGMYSNLTDAVPTPREVPPTPEEEVTIWEKMEKVVSKLPPHIQLECFRSQLKAATKREMEMIHPRHRKLEEFLLDCDVQLKAGKFKYKTVLILVDEATHMDGKARDRLVTDLCDGDLCRKLGLTWVPLVIFLANGRIYGGKENTPLTVRQIHRTVQYIYYPSVGDIPSKVPNINSSAAKESRKRSRQAELLAFESGENAISERELPKNREGNPRAQEVFYWMCARVKALNLPEPTKFCTDFVQGYFRPGPDQTNSLAYVRMFFGVLPGSIAEVKAHVASKGSTIPDSIKKANFAKAGWTNWARYISSGTQADQDTCATFAELCGAPAEIAQCIRTDKEGAPDNEV